MIGSLKSCQNCNKPMNGGVYRATHVCPHCAFAHAGGKTSTRKVTSIRTSLKAQKSPIAAVARTSKVVLTPKTVEEQNTLQSLGDITGENSINIELNANHFSNGKFVGGKSEEVKGAVQQSKKQVLDQLRTTAKDLGANTVAAVAVKNALKLIGTKQAKVTVRATGVALLTALSEETTVA